ncbi:MucR family transcriptional regulator [Methylobacterium sp. Gmos1]
MLRLTSAVTAAYVSRHRVPYSEIGDLIARIHAGFSALTQPWTGPSGTVRLTEIQIAASVQRSRIVSFIDGKPYKSLKWHLATHGLTPEEYRARFGLPDAYPMVAPAYDKASAYEKPGVPKQPDTGPDAGGGRRIR